MPNHLVLDDQATVVGAWLGATAALNAASKPVYNLIYSVSSPEKLTSADRAAIKMFDNFALSSGFHSSDTVANTIFPLDTYRATIGVSSEHFYDYYLESVLPRVRKKWGTYFERMIVRRNADGSPMVKGNQRLNPLDILTEKIKRRVESPPKTTTHYEVSVDDIALEIATYSPLLDGNYQIGGPCLSHVSFKIERDNTLRLTAFYRSHWYVERALGNLIGLARLQSFVASSSGAKVGPLTIVAAEAVLDLSGGSRTASTTRRMLADCRAAAAIV
jgi:hypothetical protein